MAKSKLEYIWLDGYIPTQNMRSKTKVEDDFSGKLEDCPIWAFDGSSTKQAEGNDSDCLLKPVSIYPDPARSNGYLVVAEVLNADGTPHESNARAKINDDDNDFWFGFEQEYFIMDTHTELPLGKKAGDEVWIARYLLDRLTEKYGYYIEYHPKPVKGDWNGSGMHANFSNSLLRTCGSQEVYERVCEAFRPVTQEHIEVYGEFNDERLTGLHETASIHDFSYGISDRGASIRIPIITVEKGWKGWLEDRRPASNADPYKVAGRIVETVKSANVEALV